MNRRNLVIILASVLLWSGLSFLGWVQADRTHQRDFECGVLQGTEYTVAYGHEPNYAWRKAAAVCFREKHVWTNAYQSSRDDPDVADPCHPAFVTLRCTQCGLRCRLLLKTTEAQ
jgi:hypothetical protein